jgi:hypothetical protein
MSKLLENSEPKNKNISTIEVKYPCYTKYGNSYFAVYGMDKTIQVTTYDNDTGIRFINIELAFVNGFEFITREQFHEKLNEAKEILTKKIELLQLAEAPRVDTTKEDDMIDEGIREYEDREKSSEKEEY